MPAPVLPKEVPGPAILAVVLQGHQRVEDREDLTADFLYVVDTNHEDEVIAPNVPHESGPGAQSLDHVPQHLGENIDDPVAVVVAVPVIELLEMIDVGVAHRKDLACLETAAQLPLDLGR